MSLGFFTLKDNYLPTQECFITKGTGFHLFVPRSRQEKCKMQGPRGQCGFLQGLFVGFTFKGVPTPPTHIHTFSYKAIVLSTF